MKTRVRALVFSLSFTTLFAFAAQAQNLLTNLWDGTYGFYTVSVNGPVNPAPQNGNSFFIIFDGEPAMYQPFPTVPGTEYQVTWDVRLPDLGSDGVPIEGESTVGPAELYVNLPGLSLGYLIYNRTNWQSYTVDFVATGTSSSLSFQVPQYLPNVPSLSEAVFMDYASAVAVPEPSLFAMLLIAFTLFARWSTLKNRGPSRLR